eukprot:CAMPEP_0115622372 /NCGR_PEP_ID=MMETSP0272-20121206/26214_1 /TAXON_ID=71861 /ORGANISM="Scrippsiella trochoidea, Strain CCMP3099" /LENGTH=171 /DNA_ID=CAMNT_0003058533 /DNA_START=92 /DNA_END=604 /DNA_ORIENTATION=+
MVHRFTSVAFRLAAVWGCSAAFEVSGQTRIPVPGGAGCYSITDREACCLHTDGRIEDASYAGQDCVPSKPDVFFNVEHQVVCQPSCFVDGSCGDGVDYSAQVGECAVEPALPSPATPAPPPIPPGSARTPVPLGAGCNTIIDRESCCLHTDGRIEDASYAGQDCVPSKPDV